MSEADSENRGSELENAEKKNGGSRSPERKRSSSPKRSSRGRSPHSPRKSSKSPRRSSKSPRRLSTSPKRSPKRSSKSPKRSSRSRSSRSPKRRSRSRRSRGRSSRSPRRSRRRSRSRRSRSRERRRRSRSRSRSRRRRSRDRRRRSRSRGGRRRRYSSSRSRSHERPRRRMPKKDEDPNAPKKFWDGFQWVETQASTQLPLQNVSQLAALQMTRKARRLHVGNLPVGLGLTTQMVADEINKEMKVRGLANVEAAEQLGATNPVLSVWINEQSNYAFVEFATIEDVTNALTLDGQISILGQVLRFGRPTDYVQNPTAMAGSVSSYPQTPLLLQFLSAQQQMLNNQPPK